MDRSEEAAYGYADEADRNIDQKERDILHATEVYRELEEVGRTVFPQVPCGVVEMRTRFHILDDDLDAPEPQPDPQYRMASEETPERF